MFSRNSSKHRIDLNECSYNIVLAGNPNVGKSTIFNSLTGLKQHTGNWTGKTVESSVGITKINSTAVRVTDLPGTYSLYSFSEEEKVAKDYLNNEHIDCTVIVADANVIERNLSFALQVLSVRHNAVLCLNLCDEAKKNGVIIDSDELSLNLGIPVVCTSATKNQGLNNLKQKIIEVCDGTTKCFCVKRNFDNINLCDRAAASDEFERLSQTICKSCVKRASDTKSYKLDKILTSKATGIPIMLALFALIFWITAVGANYPSRLLSIGFKAIKELLYGFFQVLCIPEFVTGLLIDGIYTTLSWVVAVMLPPMAIFFPLFSLIEDSGYLSRIAFNLDRIFSKFGAHGKQSLTMAMGLGCNACGVTGCRIIESEKERKIAVLTNNFMPCNGRFPTLIAVIMMFFTGTAVDIISSIWVALILLGVIVGCVGVTLIASKLISVADNNKTLCGFALELPPYRKPQIVKTIVRSFFDRTLFVLGRAVVVAIPAGAIIWICANVYIGETSILNLCTQALDPFGSFIGLDGVIVMAFILGFPANETVIPIIIMAYMANGTLVDYSSYHELFELLSANGWNEITAICMIVMCVLHFPCSTTCITIYKETKSLKTTFWAIVLPTSIGVMFCTIIANISGFFA